MVEDTAPPILNPVEAHQAAVKLTNSIMEHSIRARAWIELSEFEKDAKKDGEQASTSLRNALAELRSAPANRDPAIQESSLTKASATGAIAPRLLSGGQAWDNMGGWFSLLWVAGLAGFGAFAGAILKAMGDGLGEILREWFAIQEWKDQIAQNRKKRAMAPAPTDSFGVSVAIANGINVPPTSDRPGGLSQETPGATY
jgi:hypothetical protein